MKSLSKIITTLWIACLPLQSCGHPNGNKNMKLSTQDSISSLLKAVSEKDATLVAKILSSNPDLEIRDNKGRTPLMVATYNADGKIAELLISAGADVNAQDDLLNSPHLYAGASGDLSILKMSLNHGAKFDIYNRYGGTALIPAAEKRHLEVVKILTEIPDYPIDHVNNLGWTALMEAIILGATGETQVAIVKVLVDAGADVNIADNDGVTPLQHAKNRNMDKIAKILVAANAH
ncbi:ankyrin repeat domain-containing protein [Gelidibacter gilvus]|uniref:Ankyrin repeat domain-containing protein n=1 Tax=Gelidibacter gilvus TaxID=59602 RepID=A0A4Q0XET1_9FLAO|nr:ankyrin repeat domain-containing protein [Gelidibacter gilvus]RXJ49675.1 ankyrin repeat domain-containing protein [Gelidibacter gilvus]